MSEVGWVTIDPSPTHRLTLFWLDSSPHLCGHLSCPSQQHWSRALPLFSHMLTAYLTTGDFVRLTNRSPFPSLMSFEHFIAIWPAALEPQREWSMMETPYKKKINQTHFNSNIVRERTTLRMRDAKDNTADTGGRCRTYIYEFLWRKKLLTISFFTLCDNKTVNSSPLCLFILYFFFYGVFPLTPCVVCLMRCCVASS